MKISSLSKSDANVESIKTDMMLIKWMVGFILAFQVAIVAKLFIS